MSFYEYTYIARQDIQPQQVEAITTDFTKIIEDLGGKVTKTENWGLRNLAYRIKKYKKGHYVFLNIDGPSDAIDELERNARLHEDVIRFMTIRVDAHEEGDSIVLRASQERERRPDRPSFQKDRPSFQKRDN